MNEFKQAFNPSQQFLILQAYIDSKLTEKELLNFTLLETTDEFPVVFYSAGVMIIHPAIDLDQFTHDFISKESVAIQRTENELLLILPKQKLHFRFEEIKEAEQVEKDLVYLYSNNE